MNKSCDSKTASPTLPSGHLVAPTRTVLVTLFAVLITILPGLALAEEGEQEQLPGKLMIRGGWAYVWGASETLSFPGRVSGVGTSIDFAKTLGGETSTDALRIDTLYRFNDRHSLGFSWYRVGLAGEKALSEDIKILDRTINVGAVASSSLNLNLYRLIYNYSFYHNDKVELAVSPGLYMTDIKFILTAQGMIDGMAGQSTTFVEKLTVPLPSIGGVVNYNITPRLQSQIRGDFFYLQVGNYVGQMFEFYAGLEYRLFKNFALGAAYDRLSAGLDNTNQKNGFTFDISYNLLYLYGTIYLF